jgi:hypothetical protein
MSAKSRNLTTKEPGAIAEAAEVAPKVRRKPVRRSRTKGSVDGEKTTGTSAADGAPPSALPRGEEAERGTVMDRQEILEWLTRIKRTPVGEVNAASDLCAHTKETALGREVWIADKRACVEMAAKLQGFFADHSRGEDGAPAGEGGMVLTEERRMGLMARKRAAVEWERERRRRAEKGEHSTFNIHHPTSNVEGDARAAAGA